MLTGQIPVQRKAEVIVARIGHKRPVVQAGLGCITDFTIDDFLGGPIDLDALIVKDLGVER